MKILYFSPLLTTACVCALIMGGAFPAISKERLLQKPEAVKTAVSVPKESAFKGKDVAFQDALIAIYTDNPRIMAQRDAFEESGERFNQAIAGWLPTVNANYSTGRRRNRGTGSDWSYVDSKEKRLDVVQPIFSGGETYYSTSQADNVIEASGAQLISVTQEVLGRGIEAYLDVVRDRKILALSNNNMKVLEKHLKASKQRFDVGESTRTDVSQSQARLSRSKSDAIQAEGNVITSEAAFEQVIGYKPTQEITYPDYTPTIPSDAKETVNLALKQSPRIIAAKYTEDAADDGVGVNMSRLLPEVSLRGTMNRTEGASVSSIDFDTDAVLLDVNIPLYQGGAEYARVREAKTIKSRRRYELLQTTNEVREQATAAWEEYQTAVAAIASQRDVIKAAEVALDGVQQELLYGTRTQLDVLDAEQELFVAKVNLERSERTRMVAMYNVLAVTGRLSPQNLKLGIADYDNDEAIDDVKYQFIGF